MTTKVKVWDGAAWIQAAAGGSLARECRSDYVAPNSYIGIAPSGTAEATAAWQVTRLNISGTTITTTTASPIAWTNRLSATYT